MRIYYISETNFWMDIDTYRKANGKVSCGYDKAIDMYWIRDYSIKL